MLPTLPAHISQLRTHPDLDRIRRSDGGDKNYDDEKRRNWSRLSTTETQTIETNSRGTEEAEGRAWSSSRERQPRALNEGSARDRERDERDELRKLAEGEGAKEEQIWNVERAAMANGHLDISQRKHWPSGQGSSWANWKTIVYVVRFWPSAFCFTAATGCSKLGTTSICHTGFSAGPVFSSWSGSLAHYFFTAARLPSYLSWPLLLFFPPLTHSLTSMGESPPFIEEHLVQPNSSVILWAELGNSSPPGWTTTNNKKMIRWVYEQLPACELPSYRYWTNQGVFVWSVILNSILKPYLSP